jgi:anti-sigma factor RsiW
VGDVDNKPCADLLALVDGELDAERAQAFRDHLPDCEPCKVKLLEVMQLVAQLSASEPTEKP